MKKFMPLLMGLLVGFHTHTGYAVEDGVGADAIVEVEGIAISGNRELPNTLNIVPWRSTHKLSGISTTPPTLKGYQSLERISRAEFVREVDYFYWLNPEIQQESP